MEEAVQALMREHRQFERILVALAREVERIRGGAAPNVAGIEAAFAFLDRYEVGLHHEKEDVLFAALRRSGITPHDGALASILNEHVRGKALRGDVRAALTRVPADGAAAGEALVHALGQFIALLTEHISKEDDFLYPMAARVVPPRVLEKIPGAYAQLDREYGSGLGDGASAVERALDPRRN